MKLTRTEEDIIRKAEEIINRSGTRNSLAINQSANLT
jgi:hypothetical protein